jgi:hypothetical protein
MHASARPPRAGHSHGLLLLVLCLIPLISVLYRTIAQDRALSDLLPRTRWDLDYELAIDGGGGPASVVGYLPVEDRRQVLVAEDDSAPGMRLITESEGPNRVARWMGMRVADGTVVHHRLSMLTSALEIRLSDELRVPEAHPQPVTPWLRPEETLQVDHPEIREYLVAIDAHRGRLVPRLSAIITAVHSLPLDPAAASPDALTTLRLGQGSARDKARLFVTLARAAGMPARMVGGLVLERGEVPREHRWAEVYVAGNWVPFCPTEGVSAAQPAHWLTLLRGDHDLFSPSDGIGFTPHLSVQSEQVASPRAMAASTPLNLWALFQRLGLPFSLLRTLLILPVGALVVVLFRNVVGMPTFGTFLPALIAGAASATGALWGVVGLLVVVALVVLVRSTVQHLRLLHSPTLAILLAAVTSALLLTSLAADRVGLHALSYVAMFPIAVLAITAERLYLALEERGFRDAGRELGGTLVVILACYLVMNSLALQALMLEFPELLLLVLAADIYLGRWVGMRLSEYLRFRQLIPREVTA